VDVLTAYRLINEAGGLVIAAHANSSNGVAMRNMPFGGQTKIAWTQDSNLHALEVTDLELRSPRSTANFFNGTKPEYPRRMHCIQGSDAHRLTGDPQKKKNLGWGERPTEVRLPEVSFGALKDLFLSNDFARTRPRRGVAEKEYDFIQAAREEGANIIQDFHENMTVRGGFLYAIIADVCAFANTNGGTLYVGVSGDPKAPVFGIGNPTRAIAQLESEISNRISPPLSTSIDVQETGGKKVLRILVPRGEDPPYAVDDNKIYVRSEAETGLAVRDEIVGLVLRGKNLPPPVIQDTAVPRAIHETIGIGAPQVDETPKEEDGPPRTGVEVVAVDERRGVRYYTLRDLRNGSEVKNVTQKSARRLWHYAISAYAKLPADLSQAGVQWYDQRGLLKRYKQGQYQRYDLVERSPLGIRYYFGVTDDGIHGDWKQVAGADEG
jgi:hypothetical protein